MKDILELFDSRLNTVYQLVDQASQHFADDTFLTLRLVDDMHPLGTQVSYTCNQPHNFVQWVRGEELTDPESDVTSVEDAKQLIKSTRTKLASLDHQGFTLPEGKRLDFGPQYYVEFSGEEYVRDFLVPNLYFHLVTAYDILRANGLEIGKENYMIHLLDRVRTRPDA